MSVWRDPELKERLLTCIHEAGHTIAARHYGFRVAWVSIDPEFVINDPLARRSGILFGYPTTMAMASERIRPILQRGHTCSAQERGIINGYLVQVLAGPAAEERKNNRFDPTLSAHDYEHAGAVAGRLAQTKMDRRKMIRAAMTEADRFVEQNDAMILHFACRLYNAETILEPQIDEAISEIIEELSKSQLAA
jgi:hypothetical protein